MLLCECDRRALGKNFAAQCWHSAESVPQSWSGITVSVDWETLTSINAASKSRNLAAAAWRRYRLRSRTSDNLASTFGSRYSLLVALPLSVSVDDNRRFLVLYCFSVDSILRRERSYNYSTVYTDRRTDTYALATLLQTRQTARSKDDYGRGHAGIGLQGISVRAGWH